MGSSIGKTVAMLRMPGRTRSILEEQVHTHNLRLPRSACLGCGEPAPAKQTKSYVCNHYPSTIVDSHICYYHLVAANVNGANSQSYAAPLTLPGRQRMVGPGCQALAMAATTLVLTALLQIGTHGNCRCTVCCCCCYLGCWPALLLLLLHHLGLGLSKCLPMPSWLASPGSRKTTTMQ